MTSIGSLRAISLLLSVSLGLCGCATLINGDHQPVAFNSNPSGAKLSVAGLQSATPVTVPLSRKSSHVAVVEKEGYEPSIVQIKRGFSWWNLVDAVWLYLAFIPILYDLSSGGFWAFDDVVQVNLQPAATVLPISHAAVKGEVREYHPPSWSWDISIVPIVMPMDLSPPPKRLGIVPLSDTFGSDFASWLDIALNVLHKRHPDLVIIEKDALRSIVDEVVAQHSGRYNEETTVRIGRMIGADSLLTYRIESLPPETAQSIAGTGGEIIGSVEMRVLHVESGITLFRQLAVATVRLPAPEQGLPWPHEVIRLAHHQALRHATSYVLASLVAAFGENPLGVVPDLSTAGEGVLVSGVLQGGAAHLAGIRGGDRIIEVNGQPLVYWTSQISLPVKLTVEREGARRQLLVGGRSSDRTP
ncbi:MAG: PDZ domain-containing protein [Candidatus Binatia bacterium]